jgi:hypothetical protein
MALDFGSFLDNDPSWETENSVNICNEAEKHAKKKIK